MKIDARNPFLVFKGQEQELIKNSFPAHRYEQLIAIYQYFTDEIRREQLPEVLKKMNDDQLESFYNHHFTVLFGDMLCQLGRNYQTANPTIQFDFTQAKLVKEQDKTVWYCTECGSTDVEIKEWATPNDPDGCASNDSLERNEKWCAVCEDHTELDTCLLSEYPSILEKIKSKIENQKEILSNDAKISRILLDNNVSSVSFDKHFPTPYGYITSVSMNYFDYMHGEMGDYGELDDDLFEDLLSELELQLETNRKIFDKSQGL